MARPIAIFVTEVAAALGPLLSGVGFSAAPKRIKTLEHRFLQWYRKDAWKRETVSLDFKPRSTLFGLGVEVALFEAENELVRLDAQSVEILLDGRGYRMPEGRGIIARLRRNRLKQRVCRDCKKVLPWFDQFRSPGTALVRLRTGETNGCGGGGKNYDCAERFLESLIDGPG